LYSQAVWDERFEAAVRAGATGKGGATGASAVEKVVTMQSQVFDVLSSMSGLPPEAIAVHVQELMGGQRALETSRPRLAEFSLVQDPSRNQTLESMMGSSVLDALKDLMYDDAACHSMASILAEKALAMFLRKEEHQKGTHEMVKDVYDQLAMKLLTPEQIQEFSSKKYTVIRNAYLHGSKVKLELLNLKVPEDHAAQEADSAYQQHFVNGVTTLIKELSGLLFTALRSLLSHQHHVLEQQQLRLQLEMQRILQMRERYSDQDDMLAIAQRLAKQTPRNVKRAPYFEPPQKPERSEQTKSARSSAVTFPKRKQLASKPRNTEAPAQTARPSSESSSSTSNVQHVNESKGCGLSLLFELGVAELEPEEVESSDVVLSGLVSREPSRQVSGSFSSESISAKEEWTPQLLLGKRVQIQWEDVWYPGVVKHFKTRSKVCRVIYDNSNSPEDIRFFENGMAESPDGEDTFAWKLLSKSQAIISDVLKNMVNNVVAIDKRERARLRAAAAREKAAVVAREKLQTSKKSSFVSESVKREDKKSTPNKKNRYEGRTTRQRHANNVSEEREEEKEETREQHDLEDSADGVEEREEGSQDEESEKENGKENENEKDIEKGGNSESQDENVDLNGDEKEGHNDTILRGLRKSTRSRSQALNAKKEHERKGLFSDNDLGEPLQRTRRAHTVGCAVTAKDTSAPSNSRQKALAHDSSDRRNNSNKLTNERRRRSQIDMLWLSQSESTAFEFSSQYSLRRASVGTRHASVKTKITPVRTNPKRRASSTEEVATTTKRARSSRSQAVATPPVVKTRRKSSARKTPRSKRSVSAHHRATRETKPEVNEPRSLTNEEEGSELNENSDSIARSRATRQCRIETINKPKKSHGTPVGRAAIGRRLKIYWPLESRYFPGTVTDINYAMNEYLISYDDGDREWINLANEIVRWFPTRPNK